MIKLQLRRSGRTADWLLLQPAHGSFVGLLRQRGAFAQKGIIQKGIIQKGIIQKGIIQKGNIQKGNARRWIRGRNRGAR